jgi:hypothetical protein
MQIKQDINRLEMTLEGLMSDEEEGHLNEPLLIGDSK